MGKWEKQRKARRLKREERERRRERDQERKDHISLHHILPRCRDGSNAPTNLLRLWYYKKHRHWHDLFGDRTIEETIEFLKRVDRAVKRKKEVQ